MEYLVHRDMNLALRSGTRPYRDIYVASQPSSLKQAESWNVRTSRHECRVTLWPRSVTFLSRLCRLRSRMQNHGMYVPRDMNVAVRSCPVPVDRVILA